MKVSGRLRIPAFLLALASACLFGCDPGSSGGDGPDADTTAPKLSGVTISAVAGTTATLSATSTEAGTAYYVITTSSTSPTAAQIMAGKNEAGSTPAAAGSATVSAASAEVFAVTGLSAFTKYYYYVAAADSDSNASVISSGSFATIGTGCIARYTFDSDMTDSVSSYDLTGTGTSSTTEKKEGSASLYMDGSQTLSTSITLSSAVSVSAWVYLDSSVAFGDFPEVFKIAKDSSNYFELGDGSQSSATERDLFNYLIVANSTSTIDEVFNDDAWVFVTVTCAASADHCLYINGAYIITNGVSDAGGEVGSPFAGTNTLTIGSDGAGACFWKGYIDDVQIYNRVLSASEIAALYATY